ncbi:hypothetical protein [Ornithinimicrobium sufpigmenti]|uniref:hypothetical protein n=1 Tax=Ornithinimicrobium sufpigmenti TaxID=2508882 RepID=UPI0010355F79|nr:MULTISPECIES: hypothetical protein [unclassified Ornithinimicrobium]
MSQTNLVMGLLGGLSLAMVGALVWGLTRMAGRQPRGPGGLTPARQTGLTSASAHGRAQVG